MYAHTSVSVHDLPCRPPAYCRPDHPLFQVLSPFEHLQEQGHVRSCHLTLTSVSDLHVTLSAAR